MALNVLGAHFNNLLNITLYYPQNNRTPFLDMLCSKLTRVVVRVELIPVDGTLHGDYLNDKDFKRRFQHWLNTLWNEKDRQIATISREEKKAGQYEVSAESGTPNE